jgi:hypothetical protein
VGAASARRDVGRHRHQPASARFWRITVVRRAGHPFEGVVPHAAAVRVVIFPTECTAYRRGFRCRGSTLVVSMVLRRTR